MDSPGEEVTTLLQRLAGDDAEAREEVFRRLYDELHGLAARYMRGERQGHTLQPTALVHEAYLRILGRDAELGFESRAHFVAVAATAMRCVLVDHARARRTAKRGGGLQRRPLDVALEAFEQRSDDLLDFDAALGRLSALDPQLARIVELRFFGGLTVEETAHVLGVGTATVQRGWHIARLWLRRDLGGEEPGAAASAAGG